MRIDTQTGVSLAAVLFRARQILHDSSEEAIRAPAANRERLVDRCGEAGRGRAPSVTQPCDCGDASLATKYWSYLDRQNRRDTVVCSGLPDRRSLPPRPELHPEGERPSHRQIRDDAGLADCSKRPAYAGPSISDVPKTPPAELEHKLQLIKRRLAHLPSGHLIDVLA